MENPILTVSTLTFVLLILFFIIKFFSVFFEFLQAKGCLTVGLITLVGLPGILILTLVTGYTITSAVLILFSIVGVVTGYIARDSEGNVGKFGYFIMIVSLVTLIIAFVYSGLLKN